jgi:hypothetical protein
MCQAKVRTGKIARIQQSKDNQRCRQEIAGAPRILVER